MIQIMYEGFIEHLIGTAHKQRELDQGSYLFHQDDPVRSVFVVSEGSIELTRHQRDGASIVLQRASAGTILAEASIYSENYHCDAVVTLPSVVIEWSKRIFFARLEKDKGFANLWAAHLAREVQSARGQIEILSRKTVAERVDGWLAWQGNNLPAKGRWKEIAVQIGVSPEALYRELAKRRSV